MKRIIGYIVRAVLGWVSARRDFSKKIKLKAKNEQLEKENEILDRQNSNNITSVDNADRMWNKWPRSKK